jgi:hypothetical protein
MYTASTGIKGLRSPKPEKAPGCHLQKVHLVPLLIDEQVVDLANLLANRVEYVSSLDAFGSIDWGQVRITYLH